MLLFYSYDACLIVFQDKIISQTETKSNNYFSDIFSFFIKNEAPKTKIIILRCKWK